MKALVYHGSGHKTWTQVPMPEIVDARDAIVRVDVTTICGTDLHILKGDVPEVSAGRVLGHEAVGTVESVGAGVSRITAGQHVLVSCITSCGSCRFCRVGSYSQCVGGGGWILGHRIDGTQAEYVRVPFADTSLHPLAPAINDEAAVLLADIGPTAYEVGVRNGRVSPGDIVAIIGAGPIGLAAVKTAQLFSPSHLIVVDPAAVRLDAAKRFGADLLAQSAAEARELAFGRTDGLGVDVAIEAVGIPPTFELCTELVRPGGHIANVGVHGKPVMLHLEELWAKNVTITTGLVDTATTPALLNLVGNGQLRLDDMVTHRFGLDEMLSAYDVFERAGETGALKVGLFRTS